MPKPLPKPVAKRNVGKKWTWMYEYAFLYSKWTVACPKGRKCQVGMGVSVKGTPRGEKIRFGPIKSFTTVGIGAIFVRAIDDKGPCEVHLYQGTYKLFTLVDRPLGSVKPTRAFTDKDAPTLRRINAMIERGANR